MEASFHSLSLRQIFLVTRRNGPVPATIVFVDKVNTLQVATSTRLIYLGKYESIEFSYNYFLI